eukprot:CAMPEP_0197439742 /NCGR_PEP_ID=MMETSP1175-20131217/6410_1 /TAXON_ID=1003142 /ORGANISM="Triceratium dubium, Strain CCMP147" /LENGTH=189 /DNA_ID=CAMNT_0042969707 /DNA_START=148 /DNA_END=717 /DNA_ORIENTATION=+
MILLAFVGAAASTVAFSPSALYARSPPLRMNKDGATVAVDVVDLNDANYQDALLGGHQKAVLVDACAVWCGPCKLIEPYVRRCAEKWSDQMDVMRFDVESKNTGVKMELLRQKALPQSLPSLMLFRDGEVVAKHSGVITEEELNEFISTNLADRADPEESTTESSKEQQRGFISFTTDGDDYMLAGLPL